MRRRSHNYETTNEDRQVSSVSSSNKLTYLLVGGSIGALVALLFAPKAGQELRGDIADATRKGYDKTLETAQQLKEQSGSYYQRIKEQAGDAYSAATDKLKGAPQQVGNNAENTVSRAANTTREIGSQTVGAATQSASDSNNDFQKI